VPDSNLTDITIVLDRSGSMGSIADDTRGGCNAFLDEQGKVSGRATVTLVRFDHEYEVVYSAKPAGEAPRLDSSNYIPRGTTALLDAIGRAVVETGDRLSKTPEHERPGKVVFVILTDGQENASKEYTKDKVFEMIRHQTDVYSWAFVFLGANQDAIRAGAGLGIAAGSSMTYASNAVGTQSAFRSTSENLAKFRMGAKHLFDYEPEDRAAQAAAGATA
jgi:Mg-chelatase subunit ChlD